jgi:hypothetical protein
MEKEDFIRKLNSVGKRAFVENFDIFERYSSGRISKEQARAALVALGVSNDAGANIRLGNAKLIFSAGMEAEALSIVSAAKNVDPSIRAKAKRLMFSFL